MYQVLDVFFFLLLLLYSYNDDDDDDNNNFLVITFMQRFYNYIPETNLNSRVYSVAVVLYVQFVLHVMTLHL